jgi:hypothetical protein
MSAQPSFLFDAGMRRKLTLQERFDEWARENPDVIGHFLRFAREARNAGFERYGVKAIAERVRWHVLVEKRGAEFAINNSFMSRLARLLVERDPSLEGMFEFRKLKS